VTIVAVMARDIRTLSVLVSIGLIGCFAPDFRDGQYLCTPPSGSCPGGLTCSADGVCRSSAVPPGSDAGLDRAALDLPGQDAVQDLRISADRPPEPDQPVPPGDSGPADARPGMDLPVADAGPPDATLVDAVSSDGAIDAGVVVRPVQAFVTGTTTGGFQIDGNNSPLRAVQPGNMVLVACGEPGGSGCVQDPAWFQIDCGGDLSVSVLCNAPALTSIPVKSSTGGTIVAVTEWSGVSTSSSCYDRLVSSASNCTTNANECGVDGKMCVSSSWSTCPVHGVADKLVIALGEASALQTGGIAGWTIGMPFQMAVQGTANNNSQSMFVAYQVAGSTAAAYAAAGSVGPWGGTCYADIMTFNLR
jgi:hypothetical protein